MVRFRWTMLLLIGLAIVLNVREALALDAVVGNGDPASCNEAAFDAALATATSGGGDISFNCGTATVTIPFSLFKVVNTGNVTIDGGGRIVLRAGANERLFFASSGSTLRLRAITLREGDGLVSGGAIEASGAKIILENVQMLDNRSTVAGGAIYCYDGELSIANSRFDNNSADTGGAIYNDGCIVTIENTIFQNNRALGTLGRGGAIENAQPGLLTVRNSHFIANQALDGGAIYVAGSATAVLDAVNLTQNSGGYGGGIENSGVLTLTNSLLSDNSVSGSGGGLWNISGMAFVQRTTFSNNTAGEGGAINTYGSALVMESVNLTNNVANSSHGGGLYHGGGTAFVANATISGNQATATGGNGGGVYQNADDNLTLTNVTLVGNQAAQFGGGLYHYGRYAIIAYATIGDNTAGAAGNAIYEDSPQTPGAPGLVQIANSVIFGAAVNCDGAIFDSLGHNLSQGSCAALAAITDRDNFAGDLRLGALIFNGGMFAMQTMLPQAGSPLIDMAGDCSANPHDQRGVARPYGTACDVGAVEYTAQLPGLYLPLVVR